MPQNTLEKKQNKEIKCLSCQHYYITYDRYFPYGCRSAGFKSRLLPSMEMFANSGLPCQLFKEKPESKENG